MSDRSYRVVALPGEGVGAEVVEAALQVLRQLANRFGFWVTIDRGTIGPEARQIYGDAFPTETAQLCEGSDGILFGAVTKGGLLELRKHFDLFANLRPVKPFAALQHKSPLKSQLRDVDILFVRELVSGIYFGASGRSIGADGPYGYHTMRYTDAEIRRIAKVALQQAVMRRQKVTIAHKENALPQIPWIQLVQQEAEAFPMVQIQPMLVDNLAMQLMIHPQQFDVILAGNLFGDILSDLGGAIVGSIGLLGSASLNANGFGLYEPVHGTAPDIAGKGIANPIGALTSLTLMLHQWGETAAADRLTQAQEIVFAKGYRTADLAPEDHEISVNTQELIDHLLAEL